jgi:hypothetical protein
MTCEKLRREDQKRRWGTAEKSEFPTRAEAAGINRGEDAAADGKRPVREFAGYYGGQRTGHREQMAATRRATGNRIQVNSARVGFMTALGLLAAAHFARGSFSLQKREESA